MKTNEQECEIMVVAKQDGKHITVNLFGHTERRGQVTRAFSLLWQLRHCRCAGGSWRDI